MGDMYPCQRCGAEAITESEAAYRNLCERCTELAALEREIGRAMLGRTIWDSMMWRLPVEVVGYMSGIGALTDAQLDALIARWRELHAEGGE